MRIAVAALWLAVSFLPVSAHAQTTPTDTASPAIAVPDPLSPEAVDALVSRLSDEQVRSLLIERLGAAAAAQQVPAASQNEQLGDLVMDTSKRTVDLLVATVLEAPRAFAAQSTAISSYFAQMGREGLLVFVGVFAMAVGLGLLAEAMLYRHVVTGSIPLQDDANPRDIFEVLPVLARRLGRELIGTIVFFLTAAVVLNLFMPVSELAVAHVVARNLIVIPRISLTLLRFFLAPRRPDLRLVHTDDWTARFLFRNLLGVATAIGVILAVLGFNRHVGASGSADGVTFWLHLAIFAWLIYIFRRARSGLRRIMLGRHQEQTPVELKVADHYPAFAIAVIAGTWLMSVTARAIGQGDLLKEGRHLISLAVLIVAPLLDPLIRAVVLHVVPPMRGEGPVAQRAHASNVSAYVRIGRVLVFGAVIIITARLWGVTPMSMASVGGVGEQMASHLIQALLIGVVGYMIWEVTRLMINRRLADDVAPAAGVVDASESDAPHVGGGPASRLGTVLPMVSWALQVAVITLTVLTALGKLGIDVTPLLAGAGVVGLAIGFGAQKLVSDIMSGMFFLIDDAFRLNEYIDTGGVQGTVEKISLRSIQLRDSKGPVLIIPYSGIDKVTNFGRDWGIMKLKFTVPFDTDLEKVRKIFKKIGQEMMEMPDLAPGFIEPFKSQGVGEFNDYGVVVRGKFMHKPGAQFGIRKHIFKRVQEEFAANGIEFARREVKVRVSGPDGHLTEDQLSQAGGAAVELVEQQERMAAATAAAAKP